MNFEIITDSAADLSVEIIEKYKLKVIPIPVLINEETYLDGETIKTKEFYQYLEDSTNDIKTYQINPDMYVQAFLPYAKAGKEVLYICVSSGITSAINSAHLGLQMVLEDYPDFKLTIIDSKCASAGFGLLMTKLLKMKENGASLDLIIEAAQFYIKHIKHVFTVETLHYLIKGGRLGKVTGGVAETLSVKPIIVVDEQGSLKVHKLVRGRKASLNALIKHVKEGAYQPEQQLLSLCHGEDMESLSKVLKGVEADIRPQETMISTVGCAIGTHTGRGIVGVCYLDAAETAYQEFLA